MRANISAIICAIDEYLERNHLESCTPPEISPELERLELLDDRINRKGRNLRDKLRKGAIPHAYKKGRYWYIPHSTKNFGNGKEEKE